MKVGDKLYCYTDKLEKSDSFIYGKYYTIESISRNYIFIYDEDLDLAAFSNKDDRMMYFRDFFITEKELRKNKLNKIKVNES